MELVVVAGVADDDERPPGGTVCTRPARNLAAPTPPAKLASTAGRVRASREGLSRGVQARGVGERPDPLADLVDDLTDDGLDALLHLGAELLRPTVGRAGLGLDLVAQAPQALRLLADRLLQGVEAGLAVDGAGVEAAAGVSEPLLQLTAANLRLLEAEHSETDGHVAGVGQGLANVDGHDDSALSSGGWPTVVPSSSR